MNMIERPCNEREYYHFQNNSGVALTQFHFVLWVNTVALGAVPLPMLFNIPDHRGLAIDDWGIGESQVGSIWQISQLDNDIINFAHARGTVVYMTPGAGTMHATPVAGDYKIGFIHTAHVAGVTWARIQLTPPERVTEDELST